MGFSAVLVEGDGVGPEVVASAVEAIDAAGVDVSWRRFEAGMGAYERYGCTAPESTLAAIRNVGAALKGPFETPSGGSVHSANFYIRRTLDLYACLRPLPVSDREVLLVRENIEDHYPAIEWWAAPGVAQAVKVASHTGCTRISRFAFELATREHRRKITIVHKANNLKLTEGMFLDVALEMGKDYPEVDVEDLLADAACSSLVLTPGDFDVILTSNTFGDLLSNIGAAVAGSLGLVASANIGENIVVCEPSHGSAPDLAGSGRANPVASIKAGGMLLDHMGYAREAAIVACAVRDIVSDGARTADLGGFATTTEVSRAIADRVRELLTL